MYHSMQFTKIQNSVLSTHQRPLCNLNFQKYVVGMLKMLLKILVLNILFPNLYSLPPQPDSSHLQRLVPLEFLHSSKHSVKIGNSSQYPWSLPVSPVCFHSEN